MIGDSHSDIARVYNQQKGEITLGEVIDYYTGQGEYKGNPEGPEKMEERFTGENWGGQSELAYWNEFLEELNTSKENDYRNWKITNIESHNAPNESGFVAYTIKPEPGVMVAAFRGSEPLGDPYYFNDWKNDTRFSYSLMTEQQKQAAVYIQNLAKRKGIENLYMTGHSLGGNLALYATMNLPENLEEKLISCATFGAPGFNQNILLAYADTIHRLDKAHKIAEYQNKYDPTGDILFNPTQAIYIETNNAEVDNVTNHSSFFLEILRDEKGYTTFKRTENQKKDLLCQLTHSFTTGFEALPIPHKLLIVEALLPIAEEVMQDRDKYKKQGGAILMSLSMVTQMDPSMAGTVAALGGIVSLQVLLTGMQLLLLGTINEVKVRLLRKQINGMLDVIDDVTKAYEETKEKLISLIDQAFEEGEVLKDKVLLQLKGKVVRSILSFFRSLKYIEPKVMVVSTDASTREIAYKKDIGQGDMTVREDLMNRLALQMKKCGEQFCDKDIKELKKLKDMNERVRRIYREYGYVITVCNQIDDEIDHIARGFKNLGNEILEDAKRVKKARDLYRQGEKEVMTIIKK